MSSIRSAIAIVSYLTLFLVSWCGLVLGQENWPEYRGPTGDGFATGANLPVEIDESRHVKWSTPIHGRGWSSPVVWGNQVWMTTATDDGKRMSAICVDLKTGDVMHDKLIHENESPRFRHPTNSYASCTPAIESGRVYLHFGSYGTSCVNTETGEIIWQRTDLECDHFRGPGSSPILYDGKLIVAFDGFDLQYVVALDKETGKTVWKTDRDIEYGTDNGDWMKAYCTGAVFQIDGKPILVYPSAKATIAYEPGSGNPIWTVYHGGMNASARPILTSDGLLVLTNGMGRMDAVDPRGTGDITNSNISWTMAKNVSRRPSPIVVDGRIYMFNDKGIATCVDAKNGELVWQKRIGGSFAASPIYDGEKILAFSEQGEIYAFQPGEKMIQRGKSKLGDGFKASPAVVGDVLILRSVSTLYCISND